MQGAAELAGSFDRVLLDVPCSGTGVLAKRADLRWRVSAQGIQQLAGLQVPNVCWVLLSASSCISLTCTCSLPFS